MKRQIRNALRHFGFDLVRYRPNSGSELDAVPDLSIDQKEIISASRPFTMTSIARMAALMDAVIYVAQNDIPGDIAECGVWRGGSMMVVALTLLAHGDRSRMLYLYDTYEGMCAPTAHDQSFDGISAEEQLKRDPKGTGLWCYSSLCDVRANILATGYPEEKVQFIKGRVEQTIPQNLPPHLSLLRLDTDWYESTKHELTHLFPLLDAKGILIIDDYGHWQGAKRAVDEYLHEQGLAVYMHRIDYTGRLILKSAAQTR